MRRPRQLSADDLELISWAQNLKEPDPEPTPAVPAQRRPLQRHDLLVHLAYTGDDPLHCQTCTQFLTWLLRPVDGQDPA